MFRGTVGNLNGVTLSNTTATSGNVNFFDGEYTANPSSASTAVYAGLLGNMNSPSTGAGISSPGHTIAVFGFNHVNAGTNTQDQAIGTEGKITVGDVTAASTVTTAASLLGGLADVATGATVGTWYGCATNISAMHGTMTAAVFYGANSVTTQAAIGTAYMFNGINLTVGQATQAASFRSQMNAATAHFGLYFDGTAQNAVAGKFYFAQDSLSIQTVCGVFAGTGVPNNSNGANGDFYFRGDTPGTPSQRIYIKAAGSWSALTV